jgi:ribonuclease G
MSKEIYISSTPHETRLAIVEDDALTEIYYERENEYTLAGSIYNGRVTRVLPGMQSSFVDIGLERDAFLYITDFMEEAPDSEEFDTSSSGDRPARAPRPAGEEDGSGIRTESGPRADRERGGRGRRGGRDRNRDRGPNRDADRGPDRGADRGSDREPLPAYAETDAPAPPSAELGEGPEVGEGAPGADGSRRWRGRRGRRRGRGGAPRAGEPAQANGATSEPAEGPSLESPAFESKESFEIDGVAETSAPQPDRTPDRTRDRGRNDGRDGRPRSDNPRDGQRSNFGPRDRDQRPDRPQRVPRGFAPSRSLYGVDDTESSSTGPLANAYPGEDSAPGAEPIVLPGESLSKYRRGEAPAASAGAQPGIDATPITLAPPANLYTVAAGWDGGDVLPGESLSRRSSAPTRPGSRPESRSRDFDRNSRDDSSRDSRPRNDRDSRHDRDRGGRSDREARGPHPDNRSGFRNEVPAAVASVQPHPSPTTGIAPPPVPQELAEYEPQIASASYRVDPLPRTEYRQSAPVLEPPAAEPETTAPAVEPAAAATEGHDITSISSAGEMLSEHVELAPDATPHPAPMEPAEPASPIRHEGAVVSPKHDFVQPVAASFSPGSGRIAEEIIDDEDSDITLHASSIEEIDDLDEETLEGAADLGTMLREMSIDHITRTSPEAEEEEDDLEEDELDENDLEEDELEEDEDEDGEEAREGFEIDDRLNLDDSSQSEDGPEEDQLDRAAHARDAALLEGEANEGSAGEERSAPAREHTRDSERHGGRRDGRRDGRRPQRGDRGGRGERARSTGGSGDRDRGRSNGHGRSMQATNLPAISDLLKPGQEILVQIAKEPIAKKGARITSHIALPGRFLVFMPTVGHTGVSRKIESDAERRRLKEILLSEKGEASGGFIVRTAAEGASEEELRSDLRFLLNLWTDIKARSDSSKSPALIYHDLNLIERILRDQVTDNFSAIWVDTENEYERVLRFLQRFQPSLIRRVKLYTKETPLFEQFGITEEINKALRSKVWLKSGGSIVINQTEALVAIDINTGKYVGKTARLEDTIVKTNLDAIPEIVRQIRLRDLGGIIIIDFIDMDERKNRNRVMAALEDELKSDRAPSKVLQFNDFGLVAITRKRVKQSLERTLSTTCNVCVGTGMVKSPITVCNDIYIEMRKMHRHLERGDVMLRVHPEVVKQLKTSGAKWLQEMEEMVGKTILVKSDPSLHPEQFDIH